MFLHLQHEPTFRAECRRSLIYMLLPDPANMHCSEIVYTGLMSYTHPYISVFMF